MEASDLRKAILQYAMEGKLVKQNPNDEPASVLLERIKDEKNKLIKERKIKKDTKESYIYKGDDNHYYEKIGNDITDITDEIPFEIPDYWHWSRLKSVCTDIFSGKSPKYSKEKNKNYILGQAANTENGIDVNLFKYGTEAFTKDMDEKYFLRYGDVLLNTLGGGTVGRVGQFLLNIRALTDGHPFIIRCKYVTQEYFLYYWLKLNRKNIEESACGTTNQIFLKLNVVCNYLVPTPPLAEQERIVRKLDELMPLVDEYERLLAENEKLDNEFPDKLKQSILQYAMEGKLVEQDPNDEPASVLLDKIKQEKEKHIKEGKIKRDKNESIIYKGDDNHYYEKIGSKVSDITEEIPFEIPETWRYARLLDICSVLPTRNNQIDEKDVLKEGDVPVISQSKNLIDGYTNQIGKKLTIEKPIILFGDHTKVVKYIDFDFVVGADGTKLLKPYVIDSKWFYYNMVWHATQIKDRGYARHFILLKNSLVSLPPSQEQVKISAKLDYIFNILIK